MARDSRFDVLFEPVDIGPVRAKNRFYQVPHATGMGHDRPQSLIAMREVKAEGGWGVVCTGACYFHPTTDVSPYTQGTLWDGHDERVIARLAEAVHRHGGLAGIELAHGGALANNKLTREAPLSPSGLPSRYLYTLHPRAMDKAGIRELRAWHKAAAKRAMGVGFDIIYVYASHESLPLQFLSRRLNHRSDEYGGSFENRLRLLRELIEDTREAVGHRSAVAVRFCVDELLGADGITFEGEGRDVVERLGELPDLWDVNLSYVENDSATARFTEEGYEERYIGFVKQVTTKPVVGVGRFTSPDAMASQVRRGVLDLIGAARPSIADPFLPHKIEEGRVEDIRECIGCNVCRSAHNSGVPLRCTQNPTMGEEWRRGWHPERLPAKGSDADILVVGGGPAGLEAAMSLGKRGYDVTLAEAGDELGGRVRIEAGKLPGLGSWIRVRDYRLQQLNNLANVRVYLHSRLSADDVWEFASKHVLLATGARWRRDGIGSFNPLAIEGTSLPNVLTPDDVWSGASVGGPLLVYDDEHYYMGGCLSELFATQGVDVIHATPAPVVSSWTAFTDEQEKVQARLIDLGVRILSGRRLRAITQHGAELACVYTDRGSEISCENVLLVTAREPNDELHAELVSADQREAREFESLTRIGDCLAPGAIADAIYAGHRYARELDDPLATRSVYRRDRPETFFES